MKTTQWRVSQSFFMTMLALAVMTFIPGGRTSSGAAFADEAVNVNDMLTAMPDKMPANYTDEQIDEMLDDIQQVDDSADTQGREDTEKPVLSDADRALVDDIKNNPEKYAERIREQEWLNDHPWVIWSVCSDFIWIEAHPRFAARIYLNYPFWCQYPSIGYVIVLNRPFLVRYPRITMEVYYHDDWFILHPFVAREVYLNYVIFDRYPEIYTRYYRHTAWMHRHPGIVKIAYGNRPLFQKHTEYLGNVYQYRRSAIKQRIIREPHMKEMHERWQGNHERYRPERHETARVKYAEKKDIASYKGRDDAKQHRIDKAARGDNRGKGMADYRSQKEYKGGPNPKSNKPDNASRQKGDRGIQGGKEFKGDRGGRDMQGGREFKGDRGMKGGDRGPKGGGDRGGMQGGGGPKGGGDRGGGPKGGPR